MMDSAIIHKEERVEEKHPRARVLRNTSFGLFLFAPIFDCLERTKFLPKSLRNFIWLLRVSMYCMTITNLFPSNYHPFVMSLTGYIAGVHHLPLTTSPTINLLASLGYMTVMITVQEELRRGDPTQVLLSNICYLFLWAYYLLFRKEIINLATIANPCAWISVSGLSVMGWMSFVALRDAATGRICQPFMDMFVIAFTFNLFHVEQPNEPPSFILQVMAGISDGIASFVWKGLIHIWMSMFIFIPLFTYIYTLLMEG